MNINKISSMSFGAKPITTALMFDKGRFEYQRTCGKDVDCFSGNLKNPENKDNMAIEVINSINPENIEKVEVSSKNKKGDISLFAIERDVDNAQRFHFTEKSVAGDVVAKSQVFVKKDMFPNSDMAFQNAITTYMNLIEPKDIKEVLITHIV